MLFVLALLLTVVAGSQVRPSLSAERASQLEMIKHLRLDIEYMGRSGGKPSIDSAW